MGDAKHFPTCCRHGRPNANTSIPPRRPYGATCRQGQPSSKVPARPSSVTTVRRSSNAFSLSDHVINAGTEDVEGNLIGNTDLTTWVPPTSTPAEIRSLMSRAVHTALRPSLCLPDSSAARWLGRAHRALRGALVRPRAADGTGWGTGRTDGPPVRRGWSRPTTCPPVFCHPSCCLICSI
jgi:hypothetical protein